MFKHHTTKYFYNFQEKARQMLNKNLQSISIKLKGFKIIITKIARKNEILYIAQEQDD